MEIVCSLKEPECGPTSSPRLWFSITLDAELSLLRAIACLSPLNLPAAESKETSYGLVGDAGVEVKDTTEGSEVKEAGASTVSVKSSDVRFEAWSVKTWPKMNFYELSCLFTWFYRNHELCFSDGNLNG